jgi:hypothetical protein
MSLVPFSSAEAELAQLISAWSTGANPAPLADLPSRIGCGIKPSRSRRTSPYLASPSAYGSKPLSKVTAASRQPVI